MRENPTNLFTWATSELSQDAFICWLLAWAKPENKTVNESMHQAGKYFLKALLAKHEIEIPEILTVQIITQKFHIDVLVIINNEYAMIIEDKTHTESHGDQLERYKKTIEKHYPECDQLPTFVKTGSQSNNVKEVEAEYKLFLRTDFLKTLSVGRDAGVDNHIYLDFLATIEALHADINSYSEAPIKLWKRTPWERSPWVGFYEYLQKEVPAIAWGYVPNQNGGFLGASWNLLRWEECTACLEIEQGRLCFKLEVKDVAKQSELRKEWSECIIKSAKQRLVQTQRPQVLLHGLTTRKARIQ